MDKESSADISKLELTTSVEVVIMKKIKQLNIFSATDREDIQFSVHWLQLLRKPYLENKPKLISIRAFICRTGAFIWGNLAPTQIRNSFQTRSMVTQRKFKTTYVSLLEVAEIKITLGVFKC